MPDRIDSGYVEFYPQFNQAAARAASAAMASALTSAMSGVEKRLDAQMASAGTSAARAFNNSFRAASRGGGGVSLFPSNLAGTSQDELGKVSRNIQSFLGSSTSGLSSASSQLSGLVSSITSGMRNMAPALETASRAFGSLSQSIGIAAFQMQILGFAMTTFVSGPLAAMGVGLVKVGLETASGIEQAVRGISALVGPDQQKNVTDFTSRMVELARISPVFESESVLKFAQNLVAAGMALPDAERMIRSLGNVGATLGVSADKMNLAMLAIEQIAAKGGNVSLEELRRQLGDALPGAMKIVADSLGVTTEKLYEMVKQGLPAKDVLDALTRAGESPQFMAGAISGSTTLHGVWQQLKETLKTTLASKFLDENFKVKPEIVEGIKNLTTALDNLLKDVDFSGLIEGFTRFVNKVSELVDKYKSLTPEQKDFILDLIKLAVAAGPVAIVLGYVGTALSGMFAALRTGTGLIASALTSLAGMGAAGLIIGGVTLAVAALVVGLGIFVTQTEEGRQMFQGFMEAVKRGWNEDIKPALDSLWHKIKDELLPALKDLLASFGIEDWHEFGRIIGEVVVNRIGTLIEMIKLVIGFITKLAEHTRDQVDFMKAKWDLLKDIGGWFDREVVQPVLVGIGKVKEAFSNLFSGGLNISGLSDGGLGAFLDGIKARIDTFVEDVRTAWNRLTEIAPQVFSKIAADIESAWNNVVQPALNQIKENFKAFWSGLFEGTTDQSGLAGAFERIGAALRAAWENVIKPALETIKTGFQQAMSTLFEGGEAGGAGITGAFGRIGDAIQAAWNDKIKPALENLKQSLIDLGTEAQPILDNLGRAWDGIKTAWSSAVDNDIKPALGRLRDSVGELGTALQPTLDRLKGAWTEIKDAWSSAYNDNIKPTIDDFKDKLTELRDKWDEVWEQKIKPAIDGFVRKWNEELKPALDEIKRKFDELVTALTGAGGSFEDLRKKLEPFLPQLELIAGVLGGILLGSIMGFIGALTLAVESVTNTIGMFESLVDFINGPLRGAWNDLTSDVKDRWNQITEAIRDAVNTIKDQVLQPLLNFVKDDLGGAFVAFKDNVVATMNTLKDGISAAITAIRDGTFSPFISFIRDTFQTAITGFKDAAIATFNLLKDGVMAAINAIRDTVMNPFVTFLRDTFVAGVNAAKDTVVAAFNLLRDGISAAVNAIRTQSLQPIMDFVKGPLVQAFDSAKNTIVGIWETLNKGLSAAWDKIVSGGRDKMNSLIRLINSVIDIINKIPFITKIDKLPEIGAVSAGAPAPGRSAFREYGGPIYGGRPGTDTVPAIGPGGAQYRLDNGEHIVTKREVRAAGGHEGMYALRRNILKGTYKDGIGLKTVHLATGGRVGSENNSLLEQHRDHVHVAMDGPFMSYPNIIKIGNTYPGHSSPTSTYRPGSRGSAGGLDHHSEGRAVDWGGYNQDGFAAFWQSTPGVIELIHRTNKQDYAILGGKGAGGSSWLTTQAGKIALAAINTATAALNAALPKDGGIVPNAIRSLFLKIPEGFKSYFESQVSANGPQAAGGNPDPAVMQTAYSMARGMGANAKVLLALFEAGFVESGFRNLGNLGAKNDHDSLGFLQQRPSQGWPNPMDVKTATRSFVSRAMAAQGGYSKAGDLAQAVQRSAFPAKYGQHRNLAVTALKKLDPAYDPNGYDDGGLMPTGLSMSYNGIGQPEAVFTPPQWASIERAGQANEGHTGDTHVTVYVDGVRRDAKIEVEHLGKETARILNAGGRE